MIGIVQEYILPGNDFEDTRKQRYGGVLYGFLRGIEEIGTHLGKLHEVFHHVVTFAGGQHLLVVKAELSGQDFDHVGGHVPVVYHAYGKTVTAIGHPFGNALEETFRHIFVVGKLGIAHNLERIGSYLVVREHEKYVVYHQAYDIVDENNVVATGGRRQDDKTRTGRTGGYAHDGIPR